MSSARFAKWAAVSQETRKAATESKRMALSVSTVDNVYNLFLVFETAALQFVCFCDVGFFFIDYQYDLWSMYSGRERLLLHSESDEGKHFR